MGVNENAFASKSERQNFYKLCRTWGNKYPIYHNLPFLNVFNPKNLICLSDWKNIRKITLTPKEIAQLKKTSIDYTLCDANDKPILCIEFDGLQEGINVGTSYHPSYPSQPDPWRQEITELKLKVAYGSLFPYVVVASRQFENISRDINLTLVDGVIGSVMAHRAMSERFSEGVDPAELGMSVDEFNSTPPHIRDELIQDWVLEVEVEADMINNPITQKRWELQGNLQVTSFSSKYVEHPSADKAATIQERRALLEKAVRNGATVTLHTPDCGDVSATAWLPNFQAIGFSPYTLIEDIAFILAAEKLKQKRQGK